MTNSSFLVDDDDERKICLTKCQFNLETIEWNIQLGKIKFLGTQQQQNIIQLVQLKGKLISGIDWEEKNQFLWLGIPIGIFHTNPHDS